MKVAFITESGFFGRVERTHPNMRTELAWMAALDAYHYPPTFWDFLARYDLGVVIIPKKNPTFDFKIRNVCKKLALMQEGPRWNWQDWDLVTQFKYFEALKSADILYVHNEVDKKYFEGLVDHKDVRIMKTLMIEDAIDKGSLQQPHKRYGVMIGGNFVSWYGGFDSYSIAQEFKETIFAPSMGRKLPEEEGIMDIGYQEYQIWKEWITTLSYVKYAVHLMRTHAAGTFALNCAYLGIPCIGYKGLDTQEICHPMLSVDDGDMVEARRLAKHLVNEPLFYQHCSTVASENYKKYFNEGEFLKSFNGEI